MRKNVKYRWYLDEDEDVKLIKQVYDTYYEQWEDDDVRYGDGHVSVSFDEPIAHCCQVLDVGDFNEPGEKVPVKDMDGLLQHVMAYILNDVRGGAIATISSTDSPQWLRTFKRAKGWKLLRCYVSKHGGEISIFWLNGGAKWQKK